MQTTAPAAPVSLLDVLREREAQARVQGASYLAAVADQDSMLYWLSRAAQESRKTAGRKQVHVAAGADVDQSTIARFERGTAWPRATDKVISSYADDLDIDSVQLWELALGMWKDYRAGATPSEAADVTERALKQYADKQLQSEPAPRTRRRSA